MIRGLSSVVWRQVGCMARRPLWWVVIFCLPLFYALFMATIFGNGQMSELPIAVVDEDFSSSSRSISRAIDASPKLSVIDSSITSPTEALSAIKRGEIYGYVVLPEGLERAVGRGEEVEIPYYYHFALMAIGGEVEAALKEVLLSVAAEPLYRELMATNTPRLFSNAVVVPTRAVRYATYNPSLNYSAYLSEPFYFIILQIVVMLATIYSIGSEVESGSAREWLHTACGNIFVAVGGKLLPLLVCFSCTSLAAIAFMHSSEVGINPQIPAWRLWGCALLLIASSMAIATLLFALWPRMNITISIVSMIGSLGATLSGVTFPVESMYPAVQHLALLLPIRHFTLLYDNLCTHGISAVIGPNVAAMAVVLLLPLPLMGRLKKQIIGADYEEIG